jgi:hypothetical protein
MTLIATSPRASDSWLGKLSSTNLARISGDLIMAAVFLITPPARVA